MGPGARAVHFSLVFFLAFKAPPLTSFFLRIFHRERGSNARVIEVFLLVSQSVGLSDVPGDPGSQLPYQEFSPYYLAPI